jgi:hypothetical protein
LEARRSSPGRHRDPPLRWCCPSERTSSSSRATRSTGRVPCTRSRTISSHDRKATVRAHFRVDDLHRVLLFPKPMRPASGVRWPSVVKSIEGPSPRLSAHPSRKALRLAQRHRVAVCGEIAASACDAARRPFRRPAGAFMRASFYVGQTRRRVLAISTSMLRLPEKSHVSRMASSPVVWADAKISGLFILAIASPVTFPPMAARMGYRRAGTNSPRPRSKIG